MSHITKLRVESTQIMDIDALVKALRDIGFQRIDVADNSIESRRWRGRMQRTGAPEVIVRNKAFGIFGSDIGFKRNQDGKFQIIHSGKTSPSWIGPLMQRYIYHVARTKLEAQGFALVTDEIQQGDRIHLVLRRTV